MSRCSQFPPAGYVWNNVCGEDLKNLLVKIKIEATRAMAEKKRQKKEGKRKLKKQNSPTSTLTDESGKQPSHDDSTATSRNMNNKRPLSSPARGDEHSHSLKKKHEKKTDSAPQSLPRGGGSSFEKAVELESHLMRKLLLNLIPFRTEHTMCTEPSDEDWLIGNSLKNSRNNATSASESLVYALPYTILF